MLRRCAGEPLEHVVGWASFCGRRVELDPGVFVPRRRTELLARLAIVHARAIADAHAAAPRALVVDLCCGSGAVGLVVAEAVPGVELHAADLDPRAVRCARRNLAGVGEVHHGDLFAPLPTALRGRVDVLIANVPYVPTSAVALLPREAREHEPRSALDGGGDGLDVLRRVPRGRSHLAGGRWRACCRRCPTTRWMPPRAPSTPPVCSRTPSATPIWERRLWPRCVSRRTRCRSASSAGHGSRTSRSASSAS